MCSLLKSELICGLNTAEHPFLDLVSQDNNNFSAFSGTVAAQRIIRHTALAYFVERSWIFRFWQSVNDRLRLKKEMRRLKASLKAVILIDA